ncbi:hypothetical protein ACF0H5_014317 [Mactra antiquata]
MRCQACRRYCCGSTDKPPIKTTNFKEALLNNHFFPNEENAEVLYRLFPNPKQIIDDVFAPFVNTEENLLPTVHQESKFNGELYKAELNLNWPIKTGVYGVHTDKDVALHNAYLRACQLLMFIGFIEVSSTNITVGSIGHVLNVLEEMNKEVPCKNTVSKKYSIDYEVKIDQGDHIEWSSTIKVVYINICLSRFIGK